MEIGKTIKDLRTKMHITQQDFAETLNVSVQTISRWENDINYPDIFLLPKIASFFHVSTDYLLGIKGDAKMAKLMKTTEEFLVNTKEEAEKMIENFKQEQFPKLLSYEILEKNGKVFLVVQKEFGIEIDKMKF